MFVASLIPAALAIGSFPAWAIALLGLVGLCVVAGFLLLLLRIKEKLSGSLIPIPRSGKERNGANDSEIRKLRKELRKSKWDYAEAIIRWFAERSTMNTERARGQGDPVKDIRVTVRFADYKDLDLVKEIEAIIKNCTQWPVEIDGSNKPTIMPDNRFKVIFDVGAWQFFDEVAAAFNYGELVKATIGKRSADRYEEREHLIVDVLPTMEKRSGDKA